MIRGVFILAGLTIREAIRRRVFLAALVIAALYFGFAFLPLHIRTSFIVGLDMATARNNTGRIFAWLGCGTIKFFGAILAVALSAGAITSEIDRGVLSVIVPKPIPRAAIYLGKWVGIITLLGVCATVWGSLLAWALWRQTGTYHSHLWGGVLAAFLFPVLFTTLTLFFSTFSTYALASSLSLIAAGVALAEDLLHNLSQPLVLNAPILDTLSRIAGYVVPLGRMNHWITRGLGEAGWDFSVFFGRSPGLSPAPIVASGADMGYILAYIATFFALGLIFFQRRDL